MPDRYVVVSGGVASGAGEIGAPWTFAYAISAGKTLPGENLFMRGGTYLGPFNSYLAGTSTNYIVVRPYPGEAVKIDCAGPISTPADHSTSWILPSNCPNPNYPASCNCSANPDFPVTHPVLIWHQSGGYTTYRDIEFLWSHTERPVNLRPNSRPRPAGFGIPASPGNGGLRRGIKIINCIFHDLGNAVGWDSAGPGGEIYGCIFYNNGWDDAPEAGCNGPAAQCHAPSLGCQGGTGHDLYAQNNSSDTFFVEDNIFLNGYGYGIHNYAANAGVLKNFVVRGNVAANKGINAYGQIHLKSNILMAGADPADSNLIEDNFTFHPLQMPNGYAIEADYSKANQSVIIRNNVMVGGKNLARFGCYFTSLRFEGNRLYGALSIPDERQTFTLAGPFTMPGLTGFIGNNQYYNCQNKPGYSPRFKLQTDAADCDDNRCGGSLGRCADNLNDAAWKAATLPLSGGAPEGEPGSIFTNTAPTGKWIYVRKNKYEPKRAHIIIYNFDNSATVDVDIGQNVLSVGDTYEIRNAQNYYGAPVVSVGAPGWTGSPITIPVDNLPAAQPIGQAWDAEHPETPRTRLFNVFVLIGTDSETPSGALKLQGGSSQAAVATIVDAFG